MAYVWSGSRSLRQDAFDAEIQVDGLDWFEGRATCILLGNVGDLFGGVTVFPDARPDDGQLELGVVTAEGVVQWLRTLARTAAGDPTPLAVRPGDEGARASRSHSTARCATSSTAATARR